MKRRTKTVPSHHHDPFVRSCSPPSVEETVENAINDPPLVSAIITTYNRPANLRRAIRSVVVQTYPNIELIIVDDHSDTPAETLLNHSELSELTNISVTRHETNRGANAARNTGIAEASGEYIAFLDDDDQWKPEKLEKQIGVFREADEDVGVVYTGKYTVRKDGTVGEEIPPRISGDLTRALLCRNVVGSLSVVMVSASHARAVPFDERFPAWADLEWYVHLSRHTEFRRVPERLVIYEYSSPGRLSDDLEKKREAYELFVDKFDPLALQYGRVFRRKMRGWAAHRLGKDAYFAGHYSEGRALFGRSVAMYPPEPQFAWFFLASLGGKPIHRAIRYTKQVVH